MTILLAGCSEDEDDGTGSGPSFAVGGRDLLGLVDGRTLDYMVIDTIITWLPSYNVEVDTGTQIIWISGDGDDWIIKDGGTPLLNLKISEPFVLHNGYWRKVGVSDALVYFPVPAIAMDGSAIQGESWSCDVPAYTSDSGDFSFAFYYGYFGFHFTKTYTGVEEIFVPAFAGNSYRYEVKLFADTDHEDPVATIVEYYVPTIGLLRQEFHAEGLTRVLNLRAYN